MFESEIFAEETVRILPTPNLHSNYTDCDAVLGLVLDQPRRRPSQDLAGRDHLTHHNYGAVGHEGEVFNALLRFYYDATVLDVRTLETTHNLSSLLRCGEVKTSTVSIILREDYTDVHTPRIHQVQ